MENKKSSIYNIKFLLKILVRKRRARNESALNSGNLAVLSISPEN